jgi:hypothetical protein
MVQQNACDLVNASYPIITLRYAHSRTATHNYLDNADEADEAESHQEEIDRRRSLLQGGL